jgi:SAM-dependent methyltransferase
MLLLGLALWTQISIQAPYVQTPPEVVSEMLKLAGVRKDDLVYDLGCGDGRIVIAAARQFGARGVCVELSPARIREAQQNARRAGVAGRIEFLQQDLFDTDISKATVVTLYLLPEVNLELRPKLLRELRPGTRIVSNSFDMGDWQPHKVVSIASGKIYYWVIPAPPTVEQASGRLKARATLQDDAVQRLERSDPRYSPAPGSASRWCRQ